ncbi:hypothetical protein NQ315_008923, partial [Exocentrus adspersus]
ILFIINNVSRNDYRIKRFLKGVQNLRPCNAKYSYVWDPSIILKYLERFFPNEDLTLQQITYNISDCTQGSDSLLNLIRKYYRVSSSFTKIQEKSSSVCRKYFKMPSPKSQGVTVIIIRPFHDATSQTLSRWIKINDSHNIIRKPLKILKKVAVSGVEPTTMRRPIKPGGVSTR